MRAAHLDPPSVGDHEDTLHSGDQHHNGHIAVKSGPTVILERIRTNASSGKRLYFSSCPFFDQDRHLEATTRLGINKADIRLYTSGKSITLNSQVTRPSIQGGKYPYQHQST